MRQRVQIVRKALWWAPREFQRASHERSLLADAASDGMSRKRPTLAPLSVSGGGLNTSFELSDTGTFAQSGFCLGNHGITQSPRRPVDGEVSNLRLEHVEAGALIGRGASSRVYSAVHRPTGTRLALKVLQADIERSREARHMVINEIKVVYDACSDHLVRFYDAFFQEGAIYLALECAPGRSFFRVSRQPLWPLSHAQTLLSSQVHGLRLARGFAARGGADGGARAARGHPRRHPLPGPPGPPLPPSRASCRPSGPQASEYSARLE